MLGRSALASMVVAVSDYGWILAASVVVMFLALAYGLFTRRGSGINPRRWAKRRGGEAPGAEGRGEVSGRDQGEGTGFDDREGGPLQQRGTR